MNWPVRRSVFGVVLGVGLAVGVAGAQPRAQQGNEPEAEVQQRRTANLSGPDQLRESNAIIEEIQRIRRQVSEQLDQARQERDIIKVNCLNDKLTQIDVTLRSAREHHDLLQTAVGINNDGQRNHEFTLINIYRSRVEGLEIESRQCVGEEATAFDRTVVTLRVSRDIPTEDTTEMPIDSLLPERPLVTSPVL